MYPVPGSVYFRGGLANRPSRYYYRAPPPPVQAARPVDRPSSSPCCFCPFVCFFFVFTRRAIDRHGALACNKHALSMTLVSSAHRALRAVVVYRQSAVGTTDSKVELSMVTTSINFCEGYFGFLCLNGPRPHSFLLVMTL